MKKSTFVKVGDDLLVKRALLENGLSVIDSDCQLLTEGDENNFEETSDPPHSLRRTLQSSSFVSSGGTGSLARDRLWFLLWDKMN